MANLRTTFITTVSLLIAVSKSSAQVSKSRSWIPEESISEPWSVPALFWIPNVDSLYLLGKFSGNRILVKGEISDGYYDNPKKYSLKETGLSEIEVFSFSPETNQKMDQLLRPGPKGFNKLNPYTFRSKQDLLNYQENLRSIAKDIHLLENLKYARIVSPNKEIIEALLQLPKLEHLLLINPTELIDLKLTSHLKTLEVISEAQETHCFTIQKYGTFGDTYYFKYKYTEDYIFPLDFSKQQFPNLEHLKIWMHNPTGESLQIDRLPALKHAIVKLNPDSLPLETEFKFQHINLLELELSSIGNPPSDVNKINSKMFKNIDSLNLSLGLNIGLDDRFTHLNRLKSLNIDFSGSEPITVIVPRKLVNLRISGNISELENLEQLKKLKTLSVSTHNPLYIPSSVKLKKLEELTIAEFVFDSLNTDFIPKKLDIVNAFEIENKISQLKTASNLKELHIRANLLVSDFKQIEQFTTIEKLVVHLYSEKGIAPEKVKQNVEALQLIDELKQKNPSVIYETVFHNHFYN